jgi:upstream-binding transcription factor
MCLEGVEFFGLSQNRHPDLPRRPLSTYMLFYMEKKDKVARENPGLEMVSINCDEISEIF